MRLGHSLRLQGHLFHNKEKLFELLAGLIKIPKFHLKLTELFYLEDLELSKLGQVHKHTLLNEQLYHLLICSWLTQGCLHFLPKLFMDQRIFPSNLKLKQLYLRMLLFFIFLKDYQVYDLQ
jgi:hypothetical protein